MQLPGNFSSSVFSPTKTKFVVLTMVVNALAVAAASLLPPHAINSQASNSAPSVESKPLGGLPQPNSHPGWPTSFLFFILHGKILLGS